MESEKPPAQAVKEQGDEMDESNTMLISVPELVLNEGQVQGTLKGVGIKAAGNIDSAPDLTLDQDEEEEETDDSEKLAANAPELELNEGQALNGVGIKATAKVESGQKQALDNAPKDEEKEETDDAEMLAANAPELELNEGQAPHGVGIKAAANIDAANIDLVLDQEEEEEETDDSEKLAVNAPELELNDGQALQGVGTKAAPNVELAPKEEKEEETMLESVPELAVNEGQVQGTLKEIGIKTAPSANSGPAPALNQSSKKDEEEETDESEKLAADAPELELNEAQALNEVGIKAAAKVESGPKQALDDAPKDEEKEETDDAEMLAANAPKSESKEGQVPGMLQGVKIEPAPKVDSGLGHTPKEEKKEQIDDSKKPSINAPKLESKEGQAQAQEAVQGIGGKAAQIVDSGPETASASTYGNCMIL